MQTATYKFKDAAEYYKAYIHPNRNSIMPNLDALASIGHIIVPEMIDEEAVQAMKSHFTNKSDRFAVKTFAKMTSFILHFFKKGSLVAKLKQ